MECTGLVPHPKTWQQSDTVSGVPVPCSGDNRRPFSGQPEAGHGVCLFPADGSWENTLFSSRVSHHCSKALLKSISECSGNRRLLLGPTILTALSRGSCCLRLTLSFPWLVSTPHHAPILLQAHPSCTAVREVPRKRLHLQTGAPLSKADSGEVGMLQFWS